MPGRALAELHGTGGIGVSGEAGTVLWGTFLPGNPRSNAKLSTLCTIHDTSNLADIERRLAEVLARSSNMCWAYLFGSAARREPFRDLDIGVMFDIEPWLREFERLRLLALKERRG